VNLIWFRIIGTHGKINIPVIIKNLEHGRLRRFASFIGYELNEVTCPGAQLPACIIKPAVNGRFFGGKTDSSIYPLCGFTGNNSVSFLPGERK
jgi:hypothetical protein